MPRAIPLVNPPDSQYAIVYDLYHPTGGMQNLVPAGHPHAGMSDTWYKTKLYEALIIAGYTFDQYSMWSKNTNLATAQIDASTLEDSPNCSWMPFVVKALRVVQICHNNSLITNKFLCQGVRAGWAVSGKFSFWNSHLRIAL
ncbi:hypothetical protein PROFUN_15212 [Planoprotostelium fungivorum]|uniref:Uncharacterized protein n=1 Tax=Planoprotostelium fungivorum TaxID=1890364 RepID=A0A2P6MWZ4_9EUKA|nr:hypothetical protein PROFUN_15212 [Planoprotostelium fungivorum]